MPTSSRRDVLLEFSMTPIGQGESVSEFVAGSIEVIQNSGLDYRMNPMGTVLEGDVDEVLKVVRDCWAKMSARCDRISCVMKMDYRKGRTGRLDAKIRSIETRLGAPVKK